MARSRKDAKLLGTFPLIRSVPRRRNVVPRHKSRAKATFLGSLPQRCGDTP